MTVKKVVEEVKEEAKETKAAVVKNGKARKADKKVQRAALKKKMDEKAAEEDDAKLAKQAEEEAAAEEAKQATVPVKKPKVKVKATSSLQDEALAFMKKGQKYRTRDVVEGLGRTPGQKEGQPVTNALKALAVAGKITDLTNGNGARGAYAWEKK